MRPTPFDSGFCCDTISSLLIFASVATGGAPAGSFLRALRVANRSPLDSELSAVTSRAAISLAAVISLFRARVL